MKIKSFTILYKINLSLFIFIAMLLAWGSFACTNISIRTAWHKKSDLDARTRIVSGDHQIFEYHENYQPGNIFFEIRDGGRNKYVFIVVKNPKILQTGQTIKVGDPQARFAASLQSDPNPFRHYKQKHLRGHIFFLSVEAKQVRMRADLQITYDQPRQQSKYYPLLKKDITFKR